MAITNEMRYGISALGLNYKEYAENDELLVDPISGQMLYKREIDGQIVSYDNATYTQESIATAINVAQTLENEFVKTNPNNFIAYHTINIGGKTDLLDTQAVDLSMVSNFSVSKDEASFYVRIHGNTLTNTIMSYLEKTYNEDAKSIKLVFSVKETSTGSTQEIIVETYYNLLTHVKIPVVENAMSYEVSLASLTSVIASESFLSQDESVKNLLISLNNGNTKFESTEIDMISYVDDITKSVIYNTSDNVKLELILPNKLIDSMSASTNSEGIIISEEKPNHKCLWGKVITSN